MTSRSSKKIKPWPSKWSGGKKGSFDLPVQQGTARIIYPEMIKPLKEPLFTISNGTWPQHGCRYLYDRNGNVYGAVLTSYSERDIHDILKNQLWQHGSSCNQLESGMTVFVVPNETVLKQNPNAVGVMFTLA